MQLEQYCYKKSVKKLFVDLYEIKAKIRQVDITAVNLINYVREIKLNLLSIIKKLL